MHKGVAQGVLNVINGIQDIAIDTANLAIGVGKLFTGRLDFSPTFNSPDWSRGVICSESDSIHYLSKFIGAQAAVQLLTMGAGTVIRASGLIKCNSLLGKITGWGACFSGDTQVVTGQDPATGKYTTQSIASLRVGDYVLAKSELDPDGPLVSRQITDVSVHSVASLRVISYQTQDGNIETVRTTDAHPFFVVADLATDEGQWVEAGNLQAGDRLLLPDGTTATLLSTATEAHHEGIQVYNLTVEGAHTYFVPDDQGQVSPVWVHNGVACNGNSLASTRTAYLYRMLDKKTGEFLKWGITQNLKRRYSNAFMNGKRLIEFGSGTRAEMLKIERELVELAPGPMNLERWAGARL